MNEPLVRDNDEATGIVVEAASRSPFWSATAAFIVQDDPGNFIGRAPTQRVPCLITGGRARRRHIDSRHCSFPSSLRTAEAILGLPPLSLFDALATPMVSCFTEGPESLEPFPAIRSGR